MLSNSSEIKMLSPRVLLRNISLPVIVYKYSSLAFFSIDFFNIHSSSMPILCRFKKGEDSIYFVFHFFPLSVLFIAEYNRTIDILKIIFQIRIFVITITVEYNKNICENVL